MSELVMKEIPKKLKVVFFEACSDDGCFKTIINTGTILLQIMDLVEVCEFRLAKQLPFEQRKGYKGKIDILFVEGVIETEEEALHLMDYFGRTTLIVALGACAITGGMPGIKDGKQIALEKSGGCGLLTLKQGPGKPRTVLQVTGRVDAAIPGCPIDPEFFLTALKVLLAGGIPKNSGHSLCKSCDLSGNECLLEQEICLGPVIKEGCDSVCIRNNKGCFGCNGFVENADIELLYRTLAKKGFEKEDIRRKLSLYNNLDLEIIEKKEKK